MKSMVEDLYTIEKDNKVILYSIKNAAWIKMDKSTLLEHKKDELLENLRKYKLIRDESLDREKKSIKSMYLFLTRKCNMTCEFCSMHSSPTIDVRNEITFENSIKFINQLNHYSIGRIVISGGEPLLSNKLFKIIDYLYENRKDTEIVVQTNGILIDEEFCNKVRNKINRVNISIESIYDIWKNGKEKLLKGIELLKSYNIKLEFSFVATKKNQQYVFDFLDLCNKYEAEPSIKLVSAIGREERFEKLNLNETDILLFYKGIIEYINKMGYADDTKYLNIIGYQPIPRKGCGAYSNQTIAIMPDGEILRCHSIDDQPINMLGTAYQEDINKRLDIRLQEDSNYFAVDKKIFCRMCTYKHFCTGICSAEIYKNFDDSVYKPSICEWRKIIIEYFLWEYRFGELPNVTWKNIYSKLLGKIN